METQLALSKRRSIRQFSTDAIPKNLIEKIIDAARAAPTARNMQPWEFIAVAKKEVLKKIGSLSDNGKFITGCACCIVVFSRDTKYYLEDGCAATENILIAASDLGIGSCWVAGDKKPYCQEINNLLCVPTRFKLVSLVALGYSKENPACPEKKPLKSILHWEQF